MANPALPTVNQKVMDWYREGYPVLDAIENAAEISPDAAADVQMILEDKHYDFESAQLGEETEFFVLLLLRGKGRSLSDQVWQEEWHTFEQSLKKEARFFSRIAASPPCLSLRRH